MHIFTQSLDHAIANELRGGAVTLGNLDGVHLGHQALLAETARQAKIIGGPSVAVTFDPHPLKLLRPAAFKPLLTLPGHRGRLMLGMVDRVLILRIDAAFLSMGAKEFFDRVLNARLGAKVIVEGHDFHFGKGREGNVETLREMGKGVGMRMALAPTLLLDEKPVSSSRVRGELDAGNVVAATRLMGRPHRLRGTVGKGQERGRTLGFPTANLQNIETLIPGDGVYAVRVYIAHDVYPGAANVGANPTFGEQERKLEVHIIGFSGDLYDKEIEIEFIDRLRDTRPFANVLELTDQLREDVVQASMVSTSFPGSAC